MDPATIDQKKKIVDFTQDELIAMNYLGDQAPPRVKEAVEAARNDPDHLGYLNVFMVECVRKRQGVRARGQGGPAAQSRTSPISPTSPTFSTSPTLSNAETLWAAMSDTSDAFTIVSPHVITPFERRFYWNGISGDPPELLYRSDLETNPFYVPPSGAHFSKIPVKIPNGVFDSDLNPVWDDSVAPKIIDSMKTNGIKHSSLKTVRFTIVQDGEVTTGPVTIWIAVKPNTTNAEALREFTPNILHILSDFQIRGVVIEWYEGQVKRLAGPALMPVVNRTDPHFGINHPFNAALGIPVARQTPDDGAGTVTLLFKEVKTRDGEPSTRVLAITNKHVACVDTTTDYRFDGTNLLPILVCGERRYDDAVDEIMDAVSKGVRDATKLSGEIKDLEAKKGTAQADARSLKRFNQELENIEEDNAIRQTLFDQATTEWKSADDRRFGIVDYAPKISVTTDWRHYTLDVATVNVDLDKIVNFTSNIVDFGNQFGATELEDLFWPVEINQKGNKIPADLQLPITSATSRRRVLNPEAEDKNGDPLVILAKYGSTTKLTLGRCAGMDGYTCDEFGVESREVVVYNYTKAHGLKTSGDFSDHGDSGALIFTGKGEAFAMLHSGEPRGLHNHVTYGTPMWYVIQQLLEEYPHAEFYGITYTFD